MKQFRLVDNILGWVAFFVAAFVYCSTIEPTASFWDCPEFIDTGYKLQIGHPPGAPFFMLTANLFTHFVSDPTQVARMVNMMSALLSASCIMFLFWTITHLTRKLILKDWNDLSLQKIIAIEASGMVGALIYTFSDTFWFSAVEGEVYAYSSALTALVFWLILKWEDHADEPHSDRWLVLITYITGLSIGVHLLNLLCVPAIVLVFYYKKFPNADLKGSLMALGISFVLVAAILYGVVPGIITVGGWFELFFVNTLGMPFNTGEIVYIFLLVCIVIWAIWETYQEKNLIRQNIAFMAAVAMLWHHSSDHRRDCVGTTVVCLAMETRREGFCHAAHQKHHAAMYAHADDWLLKLRADCDTLVGQPADGPELARGYLHVGQLSEPRPIWRPPVVVRAGLHIASGVRTRRRLLQGSLEGGRSCISA